MMFASLFEDAASSSIPPRVAYWKSMLERNVAKAKVFGQILEHKDQDDLDALDYFLERGIFDASDIVEKSGGGVAPAVECAIYVMNYDAAVILTSYGANLDHRIYLETEVLPYKKAEMPLQHWVLLQLAGRIRYMESMVYQLRNTLGNGLHDGGASPNSVDSNGMDPIAFFFSVMSWPSRSSKPHTDVVEFIKSIVRMYLDAGGTLESRDKQGRSAIWWLFEKYPGRVETSLLLEFLLEHGGDLKGIETTQLLGSKIDIFKYLTMLGCEATAEILKKNGFSPE